MIRATGVMRLAAAGAGITDSFNRADRYYIRMDVGGPGQNEVFRIGAEGVVNVDDDPDRPASYSFGLSDAGILWQAGTSPAGSTGCGSGIIGGKAVWFWDGSVPWGSQWHRLIGLPEGPLVDGAGLNPFDLTVVASGYLLPSAIPGDYWQFNLDAEIWRRASPFIPEIPGAHAFGGSFEIVSMTREGNGHPGYVFLGGVEAPTEGGVIVPNPLVGRDDLVARPFKVRLYRMWHGGATFTLACKVWWADEAEPHAWLIALSGAADDGYEVAPGAAGAPVNVLSVQCDSGGGDQSRREVYMEDLTIVGAP